MSSGYTLGPSPQVHAVAHDVCILISFSFLDERKKLESWNGLIHVDI